MTAKTRSLVTSADVNLNIADHREVVIAQVAYSARELSTLLGVSYFAAQRLLATGAIKSRNTGRRYIVSGAAIRDYLDGCDEPMRHPDSA